MQLRCGGNYIKSGGTKNSGRIDEVYFCMLGGVVALGGGDIGGDTVAGGVACPRENVHKTCCQRDNMVGIRHFWGCVMSSLTDALVAVGETNAWGRLEV